MKKFYSVFSNEKVTTMLTQLTWSHFLLLLPINDYDEIIYYINISKNNNLTQRQLQDKIKSKEYQRIPIETKNKLILDDEIEVKDLVPNPILIKNKNNIEIVTEKELLSFKLYYIKDLSIKEISKKISTSENNVKYYLYSARKKVKERYSYE